MGALSRWAVRKPWMALAAYAVLAIVIVTLGTVWKGTLNDSFSLPDTESKTATDLLTTAGGQASAATASTATIIWKPASGSAVDAATAAAVVPMLTNFSTQPGVGCVTNPFANAAQGQVLAAQTAALHGLFEDFAVLTDEIGEAETGDTAADDGY